MIQENEDNHILKCRQLFYKIIVDMYAKIETQRLALIPFNQTNLRSKEYIHFRDTVVNNDNANNIRRLTIYAIFIYLSPRHMYEYARNAIAHGYWLLWLLLLLLARLINCQDVVLDE